MNKKTISESKNKLVCIIKNLELFYRYIFDFVNRNILCFFALCVFDFTFVIINIFKRITVLGILFCVINIVFMFFSNKKKLTYIIFLLYPLSRVLKFRFLSTSFLTIFLFFYLLFMFFQTLLNKQKISRSRWIALIIFASYITYTFAISLFNYKGFSLQNLFSYYLYLSIPIFAFVFTLDKTETGETWNLIICSSSYLFGVIVTILFFNLIPNGEKLLEEAGVSIFNMGSSGIRYSPLTDDPNYGTSLILLIGNLFFLSPKNKKQKYIGIPIVVIALALSCFSISKMYILGFTVLLLCLVLKFCETKKNIYLNFFIIIFCILACFVFLTTKLGNELLVRIIGKTDGISLNRITSGRVDLFGQYSSYILSNPTVVVFGKGPLFADLSYFTQGEHNTFTKSIFGNGILGTTLMLIIFVIMSKYRFDNYEKKYFSFVTFSLLFSIFLCCMSLGISTSTIFPIFVTASQFSRVSETKIININCKVINI